MGAPHLTSVTLPDLLRLLAVPVFAWAAWQDVETRRIPGWIWYPLLALGVLLLAWEFVGLPPDPFSQRLYLVRIVVSVGLLGALGFGFWHFGALGLADAKAFLTLGVLYPTFPVYDLAGVRLPLVEPPLGVFSLTILTDAVILGLAVPLVLFARNAVEGRTSLASFIGRPVAVEDLLAIPGRMLETPEGFTRRGLDLDALRMYLRWRGIALSDLQAHPDELRRPATLPAEPNPPTDGVVDPEADPEPVGGIPAATFGGPQDDPWGAQAFLEDVGGAYGTTPEQLRDGLDVVVDRESVLVSPGLPFLVPVFAGLLFALVFGDLLYVVLGLIGLT